MSIKLVLLKSGEDIITDITEMRTSEGEDGRVFLSSISGRYLFSIMESDDKDWEIIK